MQNELERLLGCGKLVKRECLHPERDYGRGSGVYPNAVTTASKILTLVAPAFVNQKPT